MLERRSETEMSIAPDIVELIQNEMILGGYSSEEAVLRDALWALADRRSVLDDIRQGIEDMNSGRGRSLQDVDADVRREFSIPHRT
jgi:hypothetical protein